MTQYRSSKPSFFDFDKDGLEVKIAENTPGIGFVAAILHLWNGDQDQWYRALARCTNSTTVTIGSLLGVTLGGPLAAILGAGIATPIGILLEKFFAGKITSQTIRGKLGNADGWRCFFDIAKNMFLAGIAAGIAKQVQSGIGGWLLTWPIKMFFSM
ncbi:hypothetical protein VNI00_010237 [Paramarasmius palmivorus]|uniref:Uncharacterized protein n=1 Tax=Paramarasmius palmivorus TaxID=297713 RepID=A0AAW0BWK6_9AGAR